MAQLFGRTGAPTADQGHPYQYRQPAASRRRFRPTSPAAPTSKPSPPTPACASPLLSRQKGTIRTNHMGAVVVAFLDGTMHRHHCYGQQVLTAQAAAVAFAAMAGT